LRLLAVDESSSCTGLAFFDGSDRPAWTRALTPAAGWPWLRRMVWIAEHLREVLELQEVTSAPDVVAMEDAVVGKYASTAISVAECRGFLLAHFASMWPDALHVTITPQKARAAVGISAFSGRAHSKDRYRQVATYLGLPASASEDECDAACIGLAAIAKLREERWVDMARTELPKHGERTSVTG
jgi:Holliday junction resolvasome RuvABC endonuclease subunit